MKKAIQFGSGNIGRGFIGSLLSKSFYEVVFFDVNINLIDKINERKEYKIFVRDLKSYEETITNIRGLYSNDELIHEIATADIITTAVGVTILPKIAENIANGIKERLRIKNTNHMNIIACENTVNATNILKYEIFKYLNESEKEIIKKFIGFPNCSVDRIVPPCDDNTLDIITEEFFEWNIEKSGLVGELNIKGVNLVDNLESYVERKLFTLNTGHTMTAYMGFVKGYDTILDSINDKEIYENVYDVMVESGDALILKYGFDKERHLSYIDKIINRFKNPYLEDNVLRVGRDPIRKLSKNDRFIKPILTAYEYGKKIDKLCLGVSLGLKFVTDKDQSSLEMKNIILERGIKNAIKEICSIEIEDIINKILYFYSVY